MEATALAALAARGHTSERPQSSADFHREAGPGSTPSSPRAFRSTGDGETAALLGTPSAGAALRKARSRGGSVSAPGSAASSPAPKQAPGGTEDWGGGRHQGRRTWLCRISCCCGGGGGGGGGGGVWGWGSWCCPPLDPGMPPSKAGRGGPMSRPSTLVLLGLLILAASLVSWQALRAQQHRESVLFSPLAGTLQALQHQELLQALSDPQDGTDTPPTVAGGGRQAGKGSSGGTPGGAGSKQRALVSAGGAPESKGKGEEKGRGKGRGKGKGKDRKEKGKSGERKNEKGGGSQKGGSRKKRGTEEEGAPPARPPCGQLSWNGSHVLRAETNCSHVTGPRRTQKGGKKSKAGQGKHRTRIAMSSACDLYDGRWVKDNAYPLYQGRQCGWLGKNWACRHGLERPSFAFENFRWQPRGCDLPKFNASEFLGRMRNKVVAFMGDSLGQQQFQSMLCMLDPEGPPAEEKGGNNSQPGEALGLPVRNRTGAPEDIGKEWGFHWIPGSRRPTGWAYRFPATNTTVLFRWSSTLCHVEPLEASNATAGFRMHLDRPDQFLVQHLPRLDLLVLNTGHHWNRVKLKGHYFHVRGQRMPEAGRRMSRKRVLNMAQAHALTVAFLAKWLGLELQRLGARGVPTRQLVMLRARSPRHFLGGDWDTGGRCDQIKSPLKETQVAELKLGQDPQVESAVASVGVPWDQGYAIQYLNISFLSALRGDAHPSKWDFRGVSPAGAGQDCLHWCLPGVPDVWNEILSARLALHQGGEQEQRLREQRSREGQRPSLGPSLMSLVMGAGGKAVSSLGAKSGLGGV